MVDTTIEATNKTVSVENITTEAATNQTAWNLTEFQTEIGNLYASNLAGGTQLGGLIFLAFMGYFTFKTDADKEVGAAVLLPTTFFMASQGLLPYGQGIFYGLILTTAAMFIFGLIKYADR